MTGAAIARTDGATSSGVTLALVALRQLAAAGSGTDGRAGVTWLLAPVGSATAGAEDGAVVLSDDSTASGTSEAIIRGRAFRSLRGEDLNIVFIPEEAAWRRRFAGERASFFRDPGSVLGPVGMAPVEASVAAALGTADLRFLPVIGSATSKTRSVPILWIELPKPEKLLTVYLDQPGAGGDRDVSKYDARNPLTPDVGHAFVEIEDVRSGATTGKRGFHPADSGLVSRLKTRGDIRDNEGHAWDIRVEFPLEAGQGQRAQEFIAQSAVAPPEFDLNAYNCMDWVTDVTRAAGHPLVAPHGEWFGGHGASPGLLGEELLSLSVQPARRPPH